MGDHSLKRSAMTSQVSFLIKTLNDSGLDLYGKAWSMPMPTGAGFLYERDESSKSFIWSSMLKKSSQWSMAAVEWILFMQEKPFFKNHTIRHALNGGEVEMTLENRNFRPDGFVVINNIKYFFCFDGR